MILQSIQIGQPRTQVDDNREWRTSFFKEPVTGEVEVGWTSIVGDGQADLENHGGVDKAICVYPAAHFSAWTTELGFEFSGGAFGENFTIGGETESTVCIGDVFQCGEVVLQISQPRQPCWKLAQRWRIKELAARTIATGRTGWYLRVLAEGTISRLDELERIERPYPEWTVERANEVMYRRKKDVDLARELASCAALAESWRTVMESRYSAT